MDQGTVNKILTEGDLRHFRMLWTRDHAAFTDKVGRPSRDGKLDHHCNQIGESEVVHRGWPL